MSVLAMRTNPTRQSSVPARKAAQAAHFHVNATGRRTALWRCDLGAELPHLAVLRPSVSDPNQKSTTDRYLAAPGFIHTPNSLSFNPAAAHHPDSEDALRS